jgi:hypothetical protein
LFGARKIIRHAYNPLVVHELSLENLVLFSVERHKQPRIMGNTHIGTGKIVLLGRVGDSGSDGEVATLIFIKNTGEDRRRVKIRNAIALDWHRVGELAERLTIRAILT